MSDVHIDLGPRSYVIRIAPGLLDRKTEFLPWIKGRQVFVVTNEVVAPLYLDRLLANLSELEVHSMVLPDGESSKQLTTFSGILDNMLEVPCDRSVTVIALGGGVIGDLAGFAAASYQRGVPFIQVPTTLLSQVDSSVGGKTGINHARGKNMVGAFHQPRRVVIDTRTLSTLPRRELAAGMAEVIKYGLINDAGFFEWLEKNLESAMALESDAVDFVVARSCENKAAIVERDERETDVRALLNLGHTFGHAIETATGYGTWLHGEAVATGMVMAAHLSRAMGRLDRADCERIAALLGRAGLPVEPFHGAGAGRLRELMQGDKKVQGGRLRLVLLRQIGQAEVVECVEESLLMDTLGHFCLDG
jgi:3-dehydroquinate synthase